MTAHFNKRNIVIGTIILLFTIIVGTVTYFNQFYEEDLTDGGFITDQLGFLSFGSLNVMDEPPRPSLYRTTDGGKSWEVVEVPIPAEYKGIFVEAEVPTFDGSQGTLLVNQGPNGDYQGGKVKAKYIS
jgi:hypothetical protein